MARPKDPINYRLLSKVSELYYLQQHTQQQIANRLHVSRPKVSRLIQQAREEGIVQINVVSRGSFLELETDLEQRYKLEEVLIVDADAASGDQMLRQQLGTAAAAYLLRTLAAGDILGVTWGRTLQALVQSLQPQSPNDVQVVQMMGGFGPPEAETHAADLSRRLAQLLAGSLTLLPAPGIVDRAESRDVLLKDRYVQAAIDLFSQLTVAYVGIGALSTNPVFEHDGAVLPAADYEALVQAGAIGDIAMRFFDADGQPVTTSLDERTIGITLDALQQVPRVVGVASGAQKVAAIRAAIRGGLIDVLITDHPTAIQLQTD